MSLFKVKADDSKVRRVLGKLQDLLINLRPVLMPTAQDLTRRMRLRFSFKRDPDGQRWKPWAPSTRARYKGQKRTLMLHTKKLRDQSRFIAGKKDLKFQMGTTYGKYHEQPDRPGTKLPRRAFAFSLRNGRRALAKGDEKVVLDNLKKAIRRITRAK